MENLRQVVAILLLSIGAAVVYGVLHDQVTARLCIEYFTVGHANVLELPVHDANPTVIGLFWGVVATWWVGAILGGVGALVARAGPEPRLDVRELVRPIALLLGSMAGLATGAGIVGGLLTASGAIRLAPHLAQHVPAERHLWFLVCGWAHGASYLGGFVGGVVLWGWIVATRVRRAKE